MKKWSKEEALEKLAKLADDADVLKKSFCSSTEHTMWIMNCLETLEEVFGIASRYYYSFSTLTFRAPSGTIFQGINVKAAVEREHHKAFINQLGTAKGILLAASDYLKEREISEVYSVRETSSEVRLILTILNLAEQKLRKVIRDKPEKEKQVQDSFENLLIGSDISYGREVDSIEYSSKTYTPDFSLPKIDLAIEVKLCNRNEREKELPEEINDDILAYQTKYTNLLFIVYDLGFIRDIDRFCGSFEEHQNVTVKVIKH